MRIKEVFIVLMLMSNFSVFAQSFSVEQFYNRVKNLNSDTTRWGDGDFEIAYSDSSGVRGRIVYYDSVVAEVSFSENNVSYFMTYYETGSIRLFNFSLKNEFKRLSYFDKTGSISRIIKYDREGLVDGWVIDFEKGLIVKKEFFKKGKRRKKHCKNW